MITNIVYSDEIGGVKTASETLSYSLNRRNIKNNLFNIKDIDGGFLLRNIKALINLLKNKKNVFILQHFDAIFLGVFLRFFGCNNLINVVHTDLYSYYNSIGFLKKIIIRFIFFIQKNQTIVFVSHEAELKAKKKFNLKNTTAIYNIFDFNMPLEYKKEQRRGFVLGVVSRLHSTKNIDLSIRVVKELNKKNKDLSLLVYGQGDQYDKLKEYILDLGCDDFVKMMGLCNNKKKMFDSIDALISFSSIEGLPTVILESICYRKPVFHTDCSSGPRELIFPSTSPLIKTTNFEKSDVGYLVKPVLELNSYSKELSFYEKDYVEILDKFIDDVRKNEFSMKYDTAPFSEDFIVSQWLDLIKK